MISVISFIKFNMKVIFTKNVGFHLQEDFYRENKEDMICIYSSIYTLFPIKHYSYKQIKYLEFCFEFIN